MSFIADLFRWFWGGAADKNSAVSRPVSAPVIQPDLNTFKLPVEEPRRTKDLDLEARLTSQDVIGDLQSLQSLTQQFDRARQDLISELQKLAPPKKRNPFWDKDAI